nr:unnamed protein product [Callosobruchus analis]
MGAFHIHTAVRFRIPPQHGRFADTRSV